MVGFDFILCHIEGRLAAWIYPQEGIPKSLRIEDEEQPRVTDHIALEGMLSDISVRYRDQLPHLRRLHWVADASGRGQLQKPIPHLLNLLITPGSLDFWQVVAWEALATELRLRRTSVWDEKALLERELLPRLVYRNADEDLKRAQGQIDVQRERLAFGCEAEIKTLHAEIAQLRYQRDALARADLERLVTYLPALYKNVFEVIAPIDLALQCGYVTPPTIPSPYPEPAPETLRRLQRDFRGLPPETQAQILGFSQQLAQAERLKPRPEMKDWIEIHGNEH